MQWNETQTKLKQNVPLTNLVVNGYLTNSKSNVISPVRKRYCSLGLGFAEIRFRASIVDPSKCIHKKSSLSMLLPIYPQNISTKETFGH